MKCTYCRMEIANDSEFCTFCGKKVVNTELPKDMKIDGDIPEVLMPLFQPIVECLKEKDKQIASIKEQNRVLSDRNRGLEFEIKRMEDQLAEKDDMIKKIQEQRPAKVIGENTIEKKESVPEVTEQQKMCPTCHKMVKNGASFCIYCGSKLK